MTDPIIKAEHLRKSYGHFVAVSDISLHIAPGEFFGLLGPNGAGKTTTISMLTGLISPTNGSVSIDGDRLKENPDICKSKIGLVPQDFAFYPSLSARDNLTFFGKIYGLRGRHLKNRIKDVLNIVVLSNHTKQPVDTFSNGMKRRLNMAIGLLNTPRILVLDEPTVGVDAQSRSAIFDSLKGLNNEGMTVIYTTHYMEEAQNLCSRIAIIDRGQIVQSGSPAILMKAFKDPVVKIEFNKNISSSFYETLKTMGPASQLTKTGRTIYLTAVNPAQTVASILQLPEAKKIGIQSLDISKPNLEDLFLNLTGRSLRDTP